MVSHYRAWHSLSLIAAMSVPGCFNPNMVDTTEGNESSGAGSTTTPTTGVSTMSDDASGTATTEATTAPTTGIDTTVGDSTVGEDSGTTGGTDSDSSDSSSDSSGSDTSVVAENCYDPAVYPYTNDLCGDAATPCVVQVDEAVDDSPHFRNGAPAITLDNDCQPQVLYSVAEGGFFGYLAIRSGVDTWVDNPTPFAVAQPGLGFDADNDETLTISDDGAFGVSVWRWDGAWTMEGTLPGDHNFNMQSGIHNGDGTLHLSPRTSGSALEYVHWDGAWNTQAIAGSVARATIGLNADATPHVGYWTSEPGTWQMWWAIPGDTPELVAPLGSGALNIRNERIAVIDDGGDGTPHLLFATQSAPGGLHEVTYATRTGPGSWDVQAVVSEDPAMDTQCSFEPAFAGEQCEFDYVRVRPIDLVTSHNSDVRILLAVDHYIGTNEAMCVPGPGGGFCTWQTIVDESEFELQIAAPTGAGFDYQTLLSDRFVQSADHAVDSAGNIHIAAHTGQGNSRVEYLRLGAGG